MTGPRTDAGHEHLADHKRLLELMGRHHVISWSNLGRRCSEPECEVNHEPVGWHHFRSKYDDPALYYSGPCVVCGRTADDHETRRRAALTEDRHE